MKRPPELAVFVVVAIGLMLLVGVGTLVYGVSRRNHAAKPLAAMVSSNASAVTSNVSALTTICWTGPDGTAVPGSAVTMTAIGTTTKQAADLNEEIRQLLRDRQMLVERLREYQKREALDLEYRRNLAHAGLTVQLAPRRSHPRVHQLGGSLR